MKGNWEQIIVLHLSLNSPYNKRIISLIDIWCPQTHAWICHLVASSMALKCNMYRMVQLLINVLALLLQWRYPDINGRVVLITMELLSHQLGLLLAAGDEQIKFISIFQFAVMVISCMRFTRIMQDIKLWKNTNQHAYCTHIIISNEQHMHFYLLFNKNKDKILPTVSVLKSILKTLLIGLCN